MSTKAIQEALRMLRDADDDAGANGGCIAAAEAAETELEAIRNACATAADPAEAGDDDAHDTAFKLFEIIAKESK